MVDTTSSTTGISATKDAFVSVRQGVGISQNILQCLTSDYRSNERHLKISKAHFSQQIYIIFIIIIMYFNVLKPVNKF